MTNDLWACTRKLCSGRLDRLAAPIARCMTGLPLQALCTCIALLKDILEHMRQETPSGLDTDLALHIVKHSSSSSLYWLLVFIRFLGAQPMVQIGKGLLALRPCAHCSMADQFLIAKVWALDHSSERFTFGPLHMIQKAAGRR